MAGLNVEYINPFLAAATTILKQACYIDTVVGKPSVKDMKFTSDSIIIMIGVTGEMRGQVIIELTSDIACDLAGKMMMMGPLPTLDEMGTSAICELGNMIMGNTATLFSGKGIGIDITPPTVCNGNVSIATSFTKNLCIPLFYEEGSKAIHFNIAITND